MSRINQYECNACKTRADAKAIEGDVNTEISWAVLKADQVVRDGNAYRCGTVHICPDCAPLLVPLGFNIEWLIFNRKTGPGDDTVRGRK